MNADEAAETIARFFNDLIGAWVPGAVLACGLIAMHLGPAKLQAVFKISEGSGAALTIAGLLFALGHTLSALHEHALKPVLIRMKLAEEFDEDKVNRRQPCQWLGEIVRQAQGTGQQENWAPKDLRNIALSVSGEGASLGRRFMFISLLCNGVGSALTVIGLDFLACLAFSPKLLHEYDQAIHWSIQVVLLFGAAYMLFKSGDKFYARAFTTPFAVAVAELKIQKVAQCPKPAS